MPSTASRFDRLAGQPGPLLPFGATLSVVAPLLEGPESRWVLGLAVAGAAIALAGWFVYLWGSGLSSLLGVRFFSILAMALGISSLLVAAGSPRLGWIGVGGLWLAALGAGVEWRVGRTYGTNPASEASHREGG
jgi:hypothetical protein